METIIYNEDNLNNKDINWIETRLKALLINSKNEILIGYSYDTYQFIGGHLEDGEDIIKGLVREVEEESGIDISNEEIIPFFYREKYIKDYPTPNTNSCYQYYYFVVRTDQKPNLDKVNYTEAELIGKFELRYIPLSNLEQELEDNKKISEKTKIVQEENLEAIKIYKKL